MFCVNCGTKNKEKASYCSRCGKNLQLLSDGEDKEEVINKNFVDTTNTSLFGYYLIVLQKFAVFQGRARRREYWGFVLFNTIIYIALMILEAMFNRSSGTEDGILSTIYNFGVMIPSLAVGVRRMHDVDKSGWNLLIPIYSIILLFRDGTRGNNHYGSDPKSE